MIIYEIEAIVKKELIDQFEQYMSDRHMPGLIKTGFFESAEFTEVETGKFVIRYELTDQEKLDEYLTTRAKALRKDFAREFPTGIELTRRIYDPEEELAEETETANDEAAAADGS